MKVCCFLLFLRYDVLFIRTFSVCEWLFWGWCCLLVLGGAVATLDLLYVLTTYRDSSGSSPRPGPHGSVTLAHTRRRVVSLKASFTFHFFGRIYGARIRGPGLFVSPLDTSLYLSVVTGKTLKGALSRVASILNFSNCSLRRVGGCGGGLIRTLLSLSGAARLKVTGSV